MNVFSQVQEKFDSHLSPDTVGDSAFALSAHPYNILIPVALCLILVAISWNRAKKLNKKGGKYEFLKLYLLANLIYLALGILLLSLIGWILIYFSFFWVVSLIFYGVQVFLPIMLLYGAFRYKSFKKMPKYLRIVGVTFALTSLTISFYAYFIEPYQIEITEHSIDLPGIEQPLTIVHLTDIQTDFLGKKEQDLVEKVKGISPDLILITGDYFNGAATSHLPAFESAKYVLDNLEAPLGVYGVSSDSNLPGSHKSLFLDNKNGYLENRSVTLDLDSAKLNLVGISRHAPDPKEAWSQVDESSPTILLYHGPEIFFDIDTLTRSPELILVGHTHGGQVALPFIGPLTSGTPYGREYARGWFEKDGTKMYVNRGIGLEGNWAPKIRFFARPEIAIINIK